MAKKLENFFFVLHPVRVCVLVVIQSKKKRNMFVWEREGEGGREGGREGEGLQKTDFILTSVCLP